MAKFELVMPKMGESIIEATILKWVKQVGDEVDIDDTIVEIATDKVDSEVPSPVSGIIKELLFSEEDTVPIGQAIAIIETEGEEVKAEASPSVPEYAGANGQIQHAPTNVQHAKVQEQAMALSGEEVMTQPASGRFYSPLVRNIAQKENISLQELDRIAGTGSQGRVTKKDILAYIDQRGILVQNPVVQKATAPAAPNYTKPAISTDGRVEIIEMDRMRKLIADHMVMSKQTSAHVTSFVEVDVTNVVNWRKAVKKDFLDRFKQKITFTPIFIEAVIKAIGDFPMINISVEGTKLILKKDINIGMATALPSGNLIVPVIKNADQLNLLGLTKQVNDLASRARNNQLKPHEIQDGTFTITNVGTFGNVMGTPIINQPQVAILAVGAIRKKPAVVETEYGDLIAVRHMMFLSLSYDHRVVDGFLGGSFLRKIGDYLEQFDVERTI